MYLYKEGDLVTIKLSAANAACLNTTRHDYILETGFKLSDIVKHEPAPALPFDWNTAKQGMAFVYQDCTDLKFFMCHDPEEGEHVLTAEYGDYGFQNSEFLAKRYLTRAPHADKI